MEGTRKGNRDPQVPQEVRQSMLSVSKADLLEAAYGLAQIANGNDNQEDAMARLTLELNAWRQEQGRPLLKPRGDSNENQTP
jgi:hypothetical protein